MSAQDDMLQPLVDHTLAMVRRHTRNGDMMLRYCARMQGIAARFDDVVLRRMSQSSGDKGATLLMGSLTAKIEHAFRQAEDLRVWLEAQRVLGRTP